MLRHRQESFSWIKIEVSRLSFPLGFGIFNFGLRGNQEMKKIVEEWEVSTFKKGPDFDLVMVKSVCVHVLAYVMIFFAPL